MAKMQQFALTATLLAITALGTPGVAGAAEFNQFIVFGDSTLDTGYFRYHTSGNQQFDDASQHRHPVWRYGRVGRKWSHEHHYFGGKVRPERRLDR